jgi:hypothetical protein
MAAYLANNLNQEDVKRGKKVTFADPLESIRSFTVDSFLSQSSLDDILAKLKTWDVLLEEIHNESQSLAGLKNLSNLDKATELQYQKILTSLDLKLKRLRFSEEVKKNPSYFYDILITISNALPIDHKPTQAELEALIALGQDLKKHPSLIFKPIGLTLIILGSVLAVAAGILLSIGTVGIGSPLGILLATEAVCASVAVLTGVGFFAYGTSHISQEVDDLTEVIHSHI